MFFRPTSRWNAAARGRSARAFSLVEVMIVIVIIGLLAGAVAINVRSYLLKAKQNTARDEISTAKTALESFYSAYSKYPTNEEGLDILTVPSEKFPEPPLTAKMIDPWGNPYQYNCPGSKGPYEIICYGADGKPGGEGADADISSDNLKE